MNNAGMNLIKLSRVPVVISRALHNHLFVTEGNEEHLTNLAEMSTTIIVAQLVAHGLGIKNNSLASVEMFSLKREDEKSN